MRTMLTLQLNLPLSYPLIKSLCIIPFGSGGCENQFLRLWPDIGQQLTLTALLRLPIKERRFPYPRYLIYLSTRDLHLLIYGSNQQLSVQAVKVLLTD